MNENTHIQNLIDKFLEASTTEAEEKELADYFASCENVPPQWQDLAVMFVGFASAKGGVKPTKKQKPKVRKLLWLSAAASVAILLGVSFLFRSDDAEPVFAPIPWREFVLEASVVLPGTQSLSEKNEKPEYCEKKENNAVQADLKNSKTNRKSLVSAKKAELEDAILTTEEIFRNGVAAIEDDKLREEVEMLSLEYELKAIKEEADRFVEEQNTIIVSL